MYMTRLEPTDYCGCGDIGYLTIRSLPIDLVHGVGKIKHVPVYHCRTDSCPEFIIPSNVAQRLDELAEKMETTNSFEIDFSWKTEAATSDGNTINELTYLHAFILQLNNRIYEDAKVVLIVPEQAVIFQSLLDRSEYYILQYEPEYRSSGIWLSLSKFYYDQTDLTYEDYLQLSEEGFIKELGVFTFKETEEALEEIFGNIL